MPTLNDIAEWPASISLDTGVKVSVKDDGSMLSIPVHENSRRTWTLVWRHASDTVRSNIDTLHTSTKGGATSMDWTPPDESATKVRFLPGSQGYTRRRVSATTWQIILRLEEALGV